MSVAFSRKARGAGPVCFGVCVGRFYHITCLLRICLFNTRGPSLLASRSNSCLGIEEAASQSEALRGGDVTSYRQLRTFCLTVEAWIFRSHVLGRFRLWSAQHVQSCRDISFQNENSNSISLKARVDSVHSAKPDLNDKTDLSEAVLLFLLLNLG